MYYNDILSKTSDFLKPHDRHILTCHDWSRLPLSVQVVSTQYSGSLTLFPIPARHTRRALRQGRYCQMRHFSPSAAVNLTFVTNTFKFSANQNLNIYLAHFAFPLSVKEAAK